MFENILIVMGLGWVGAMLAAPEVPSAVVLGLEPLIASVCGRLVVCVHRPPYARPLTALLLSTHLLALALFPWTGGTPWAALTVSDTWTQAPHCFAVAALASPIFIPYALTLPGIRDVSVRLALRAFALWTMTVLLALELHCALPAMEYRWVGHGGVLAR